MRDDEAQVMVTVGGHNGDLPDPVNVNATDADVKAWLTEALRTGTVVGVPAQEADLSNYVIDRFPAAGDRPSRILARPKTPFGL